MIAIAEGEEIGGGEEGKMMRRVQVAVAGLRRAETDCIGAQVSLLCCSFSAMQETESLTGGIRLDGVVDDGELRM